MTFRAILLKKENDQFSAGCGQIAMEELRGQPGNTLIKVDYSTLNYKDALAITNSAPVVRQWPMVAGIDCAGTVVESADINFKPGQKVILNGWGVGETHWGCLAEYVYIPSQWLIELPQQMTSWQAMALGTAGYTAALCVLKIVSLGIKPADGKVLVSGATGGVGSAAVVLLTKMGFEVTASTGKISEEVYLKKLGATEVIDRNALSAPGKPLQKEQWVAAVDTVGSHTLANICAQTRYGGVVAACGLAQGMDLPTTVAPFILRGVTLAGVDSVMASLEQRQDAWNFIAQYFDLDLLNEIAQTIALNDSVNAAKTIMSGQLKGRYVVDVNK